MNQVNLDDTMAMIVSYRFKLVSVVCGLFFGASVSAAATCSCVVISESSNSCCGNPSGTEQDRHHPQPECFHCLAQDARASAATTFVVDTASGPDRKNIIPEPRRDAGASWQHIFPKVARVAWALSLITNYVVQSRAPPGC